MALIGAKLPSVAAPNGINRRIKTADQPVGSGTCSARCGFGVVDAYQAVTAAVPSIVRGSAPTSGDIAWRSAPARRRAIPRVCENCSRSSSLS